VDPRVDLDDGEKRKFLTLLGLELQPLGRPARSQTLYQLSYLTPKREQQSWSWVSTRREDKNDCVGASQQQFSQPTNNQQPTTNNC
jgi:hypothetical protein